MDSGNLDFTGAKNSMQEPFGLAEMSDRPRISAFLSRNDSEAGAKIRFRALADGCDPSLGTPKRHARHEARRRAARGTCKLTRR